jgi:hypothetical protein
MHTIFLCNFSKYASCDSPNTPFLLSRWKSILIMRDIHRGFPLLNFEDKKLFFFYNRLASLLTCKMSFTCTIRKWIFPFYNFVQMMSSCCLLNPKIDNQLWMLSFVNDFFRHSSFSPFTYVTKTLRLCHAILSSDSLSMKILVWQQ